MLDQNTFTETLRGVSEIVRTAGRPMSDEEIMSYFSEMELTEEQKGMVLAFMQLPEEMRNPHPEEEKEEASEENEAEEESAEESGVDDILEAEELPLEKLSDSAFYRMYLEEVKEKNVQDDGEQLELYRKYMAGDDSVMEPIVNNWLLRVVQIAKVYKSSPVNMEDLIQEGNMGLWMALGETPDVDRAEDVEMYLTGKVKDAMENYIREITGDADWLQALLGKAALLLEARNVLRDEKGEEPSLRQISEYTHIPAEEIQDILALYREQNKNDEESK